MAKRTVLRVCQITQYLGLAEAMHWAARVTTFEARIHRKAWKMGRRKQFGYAVVRVLQAGEKIPGHIFRAAEEDLIAVENMLKRKSG